MQETSLKLSPKHKWQNERIDVLSSLTGLDLYVIDTFPSHEWLGCFQGHAQVAQGLVRETTRGNTPYTRNLDYRILIPMLPSFLVRWP